MEDGLRNSVPIMVSMIGLVLAISLIFRTPLSSLLQRIRQRYWFPWGTYLNLALKIPLPPINQGMIVIAGSIGGLVGTIIATWIFATILWTISLPFFCGAGCIIAIWLVEQQQHQRLNQQLIDAVAEMASAMNSGMTLNAALKQVGERLSDPLATPWRWMTQLAGAAIIADDGTQRFLQMKDCANMLAAQSTNRVFVRFLEHLEAAADLPHTAARDRMLAVSDALYTSHLREKSTRAKLAHARGSGIIVTSVGCGIALFLRFAMAEQWVAAFTGPFGPPATLFFGLVFSLPLIGIMVLTRVPLIDF